MSRLSWLGIVGAPCMRLYKAHLRSITNWGQERSEAFTLQSLYSISWGSLGAYIKFLKYSVHPRTLMVRESAQAEDHRSSQRHSSGMFRIGKCPGDCGRPPKHLLELFSPVSPGTESSRERTDGSSQFQIKVSSCREKHLPESCGWDGVNHLNVRLVRAPVETSSAHSLWHPVLCRLKRAEFHSVTRGAQNCMCFFWTGMLRHSGC